MGTPTESVEGSAGPSVVYDVSEGVGTIRLNRPEAHNSLDIPTKELLRDTVTEAANDPAVRCVVLTGTGRSFCTGQDLKEHIRLIQEGRDDALGSTVAQHYNPTVSALASMDKPVLAAVNGVAAGAGASLAFACDLRIVAESAGFNMAFSNVALSCDTGSSYTLQRLVGPAKALELLYFPRTVPADEALALGLATQVVPDDSLVEVATEVAVRLAAGPTVALGSIRASVAYAREHSFAEALEHEGRMMARTFATQDHRAAVAAFVAKEKPSFEGR
jgi:2-(1,2-epoxy-1,2-dihydrophenyl)acetyl-CoA isomerase